MLEQIQNTLSSQWIQETLIPWLTTSGARIVLITGVFYVLHRIAQRVVERLIKRLITSDPGAPKGEEEKREKTLISVVHTTLHIVIIIGAGLVILSELGVNTGPLVALAGIGGLAFGFGGQYLIKDIINGLFILLENQYRVGDFVCFEKTCGTVEKINLRRTVLRNFDGVVHTVPNGKISTASNHSSWFARINLTLGVSYSADIEKIKAVVNKVGNELAKDPDWKDKITDPPQFLRISDFADSAVIIRILGETKPGEQWAATGELRKRLKETFDAEGIEIPFNQMVVHTAKE